jgi:NAD(P)-dependent dehydrogenase (short-subunit alcohol dehydrogenase family)
MLKQEPLEGFESRGSIVNVTSLCATISIPGLSAYSATKAGALGLTKVDAFDFGPEKIRINSVGPGNTITPMVQNTMGDEHMKRYAASTPLRRLAQPVDIATAIVWLSSPRAQYITGITLPVDGGMGLRTGPP